MTRWVPSKARPTRRPALRTTEGPAERGARVAGAGTSSARHTVRAMATWREHLPPIARHVDVRDCFTTIGQQHRDVDQDRAPAMNRHEAPSTKGRRQGISNHIPEVDAECFAPAFGQRQLRWTSGPRNVVVARADLNTSIF